MKRSIIIFAILSCFQYILCQNTWQRDSIMYMAAYKYIINDSINKNRLIAVADSTIDLTRSWKEGLDQFPEEREKLAQYYEKQYFVESTNAYSPLLVSLFRNQDVKRSNTILFFSEIIDLMLRADINFFSKKGQYENDKFKYESYMFGISCEYLFIFNEDGTIKKALWREIILN